MTIYGYVNIISKIMLSTFVFPRVIYPPKEDIHKKNRHNQPAIVSV